MEYATNSSTDATKPVEPAQPTAAVTMHASPVDDLEKRLAVLKEMGVREYQDGPIHIMFERPQPRHEEDPVAKAIRDYEESLGANGG